MEVNLDQGKIDFLSETILAQFILQITYYVLEYDFSEAFTFSPACWVSPFPKGLLIPNFLNRNPSTNIKNSNRYAYCDVNICLFKYILTINY